MRSVDQCGALFCGDDDEEDVRETRDALYQLATICVDMYIEETCEDVGGEENDS